ncbi:MAG: glycerol-3-phosphate 1-O-acyltransferase PlsY [Candidatus Cloacimonetes bacterium]|nr:glycerol-3-phosphate 1-O-acyltransferase PlsY [Candidatus Cloacimonadota bacterium]
MQMIKYIMPLIAYLLGSIPIGWILARLFFRTDIRAGGSGNIGATNALRQFGTLVGVLVLLLDMGKGIVAVLLAKGVYPELPALVVLCGLIAILGHIFPVWLKFKGGKGVATAAGVVLALLPWGLLLALGVFILVVAASRYVSLGSILAALSLLIYEIIKEWRAELPNIALLCFTILVVGMIIYKHKENISRLRNGRENKITFSKKGKR